MARISSIQSGCYRLPLATVLSDAMHGDMLAFELNTVRLRDDDGVEGVGYTYTCGRNGAAIDAVLKRDFPELLVGEDADRIEFLWIFRQSTWRCGTSRPASSSSRCGSCSVATTPASNATPAVSTCSYPSISFSGKPTTTSGRDAARSR